MNPEVSNRLHIRPHPNRNKHAHALEDRALNSAFQHSASTSGTLFPERTAVSLASDVFLACLFHSGSSSYVKVSLRSPIITPPFPPKPASSATNETSGLSDNPEDQTELSAEYSAGRKARGLRWICQGRTFPPAGIQIEPLAQGWAAVAGSLSHEL